MWQSSRGIEWWRSGSGKVKSGSILSELFGWLSCLLVCGGVSVYGRRRYGPLEGDVEMNPINVS